MNKILSLCRKYWKRVIFTISILLFLFMMCLLLTNNVSNFDNYIYNLIIKIKCEPVTIFFKFITFLCSTWFILILTIIIMIFSKNKKNAFLIALNVLLCYILNQTLKLIFVRDRPIDINLIIENGYSFPSGHSMISLAYYGFFLYIINHKKIKNKYKLLYSSLITLLVLLIGISRIYLGVHFASDVIAGYAISMAYLIVYIKLFYQKMKI